ncbi:hypothetical protein ACLOJK_018187 [Asimina triloba]
MGTVPSDDDSSDQQSERLGSYCVSADVSASESCSSSFSGTRYGTDAGSSSPPPSPGLPAGGKIATSPELLMAVTGKDVLVWGGKEGKRETDLSEVEIIKERFAKLLLGEDMSGGGKGVCTALAISNAITNLSASVFGELWRLEPLAQQKKLLWHREMELLLCVSDSIVELVPSIQEYPGSHSVRAFEVMVARPRSDLYVNLPALRKLDAMLLSMLDGFQDMEFWYVDRAILTGDADDIGACISSSFGRPSVRQEDKWWLPCPRVPPEGLSDDTRKRLQQCRDCTNQILKAAMAINSSVLAEMDVPDAYIESLPKIVQACIAWLGDVGRVEKKIEEG